ncbi:MAG TPA: glycosyltransferase family 4 protein [Tepidisphaeraceae bacterium]|nr:glycosyltransferase family 4 protein [Tepidisphaeraceae bacterium]
MPHLCLIFEATGPYNAIGKIAMAQVEAALSAGWRVSVVAHRLDESLQGRVEWLRLYVPPRGFAVQWLTGRHFIRKALGDPSRFDVIHGHQPQIADLCDIYQCHFLTRAAHECGCLLDSHGWKRPIEWAQKRVVLPAEDHYYRHWNQATRMIFCSQLTQTRFARYYGLPRQFEVMLYPSPQWDPTSMEDRHAARRELELPQDGIVAGFLGGLHERKGYDRVIRALKGQRDITFLMGGSYSDGFHAPELDGHFRSIGLTANTRQFYAACDALIVASYFEPFGYVASEAAARGIPVVATDEVGALPHLLEHGAGVRWDGQNSLASMIREIHSRSQTYRLACRRYTEALSAEAHDRWLIALYEQIASSAKSKSPRISSQCAVGSLR